jgi:endogenous inhibitor of DNA gyrase (YacG/DUF329 family)
MQSDIVKIKCPSCSEAVSFPSAAGLKTGAVFENGLDVPLAIASDLIGYTKPCSNCGNTVMFSTVAPLPRTVHCQGLKTAVHNPKIY